MVRRVETGAWRRRWLFPGVLALSLLVPLFAASAQGVGPAARRVAAGNAGPYGTTIVATDREELLGYDLATDTGGTSYLGWISADLGSHQRRVHLCVLPASSQSCSGGVQTIDSLGVYSANGLRVLAPPGGPVTLVWFHDTAGSGAVARATVSGGVLGSPADMISGPHGGGLLTAAVGPGGSIWVVATDQAATVLGISHGLGTTQSLTPGFAVGHARLAFAGATPVLVLDRFGWVRDPIRVSYRSSSGTWSKPAPVARTWNADGAFDVVTAKGAVRLVSSVPNANGYPQVSTWQGRSFGRARPTGDRPYCAPQSHDLVTDVSGRLADVSLECEKLAVANQPQRATAAIVRLGVGGTPAASTSGNLRPQLTATGRGLAWVAWARSSSGGEGATLLARRVRLPALLHTVHHKRRSGKVTLRGPVSCMPAVTVKLHAGVKAHRGWKRVSKRLRLDGHKHRARLVGARLKPGSRHRLVIKAVFVRKHGRHHRQKVTRKLRFIACPAG